MTGTAASVMALCDQTFNFTNSGTANFTQGKSEAFGTYGVLQATSQVITSTFFASPTGTASANFADDILLSGVTTATMIHIVFLESHLGSVALDQVREFVNGALCTPASCTASLTLGVSVALAGEVRTGAFTPGQGGPNSAAISLSRIELLNSMGNPISATGVTYSTGSGTAYNFPGATFVPEPVGLTLLAGPLAGLLLVRLRRLR